MIRLTRPACPDPNALQANYKAPVNKAALETACFQKCMYCESKVSHVYFGDVEHIKPKAQFPALEFVWDNLGYVCARCNNAKSNHWNTASPLIDPFTEDPPDHLAGVGAWVWHRNGSQRGEYTQRTLDLNRSDLIERRVDRIQQIRNLVDRVHRTQDAQLRVLILNDLESSLTDDSEYAMVSRAAYKQLAGS